MTSVWRSTAVWTGFNGAPGYTRFSWSTGGTDTINNAILAAHAKFFTDIKSLLSSAWTITFSPEIVEYDMASGQLLGIMTAPTVPPPMVGFVTAAAYPAGAGISIMWNTGAIFNGHRVRGRTFIVPYMGGFDTDGTPTSGNESILNTAGVNLIADSSTTFAVWSRQWNKTVKPPVQIGGAVTVVTGQTVKDQTSSLRSRRT